MKKQRCSKVHIVGKCQNTNNTQVEVKVLSNNGTSTRKMLEIFLFLFCLFWNRWKVFMRRILIESDWLNGKSLKITCHNSIPGLTNEHSIDLSVNETKTSYIFVQLIFWSKMVMLENYQFIIKNGWYNIVIPLQIIWLKRKTEEDKEREEEKCIEIIDM